MFQLSYQRPSDSPPLTPAPNLFFLPPSLARSIDGKPLEEVLFLRDEMANMAWGVERLIENSLEQSLNRYESAARATASQPLVPDDGIPVYGSTHLWMGRHKQVGRGEGSSGLRFDTVE